MSNLRCLLAEARSHRLSARSAWEQHGVQDALCLQGNRVKFRIRTDDGLSQGWRTDAYGCKDVPCTARYWFKPPSLVTGALLPRCQPSKSRQEYRKRPDMSCCSDSASMPSLRRARDGVCDGDEVHLICRSVSLLADFSKLLQQRLLPVIVPDLRTGTTYMRQLSVFTGSAWSGSNHFMCRRITNDSKPTAPVLLRFCGLPLQRQPPVLRCGLPSHPAAQRFRLRPAQPQSQRLCLQRVT